MARLVTFDCFDTVLTRMVGAPRSVAYVVAARLRAAELIAVDPEVFVHAREEAERLASRRHARGHTLADIAVQLADLLALPASAAETLERAELDVEHELSRVVPTALPRINGARASGAMVGFLSDTPLDHRVVAGLLRNQGILEPQDQVWVSNELQASKNRGDAYSAVAARLTDVGDWSHFGDDERGDVHMARVSGVDGRALADGRLNRYETLLEAGAAKTGGFSSLLAGAARRTRLALASERPEMPAARSSVVAGVAAPLIVGYVLWCLNQARQTGCKKVYFVARDGEVLLAVARRLVAGLGLDLDLRYLEGSRRAWLLPSLGGNDTGSIASVLGREEKVTLRGCLRWLDLVPEEVSLVLETAGWDASTWDDRISPEELGRVVELLAGAEMGHVLTERAEERLTSTRDYLRDAGLLDAEPYALVDLAGRGTVGRLLSGVLERCGGQPPAVECYFGLTLPRHEALGRNPRGYMYDDWRGTGTTARFPDDWVVVEMFTAPTHGRVRGYERVGDTVRAVRASAPHQTLAWGLEDVRHGLDIFCSELAPALGLLDPYVDVRATTWGPLQAFWLEPTTEEADAWGTFPFEEADGVHYPIGEGFTVAEMFASAASGRPRMRRRGTWPAAVRMQAPAGVRALHRGVRALKRSRKVAARLHQIVGLRRELRASLATRPRPRSRLRSS